jgi:hypothetical protein
MILHLQKRELILYLQIEGDIGIYSMAVSAYFSYGISVFSLKNCGITILKILRYTVFAILDSKTAVIDKICLRYYGIEYPPMPPSKLRAADSVNKQWTILWETSEQVPP